MHTQIYVLLFCYRPYLQHLYFYDRHEIHPQTEWTDGWKDGWIREFNVTFALVSSNRQTGTMVMMQTALMARMKLPSNMQHQGSNSGTEVRSPERLPQSYNPRPVAVDRGRCDFKSLSHKKDWERKGFQTNYCKKVSFSNI